MWCWSPLFINIINLMLHQSQLEEWYLLYFLSRQTSSSEWISHEILALNDPSFEWCFLKGIWIVTEEAYHLATNCLRTSTWINQWECLWRIHLPWGATTWGGGCRSDNINNIIKRTSLLLAIMEMDNGWKVSRFYSVFLSIKSSLVIFPPPEYYRNTQQIYLNINVVAEAAKNRTN